MRSRQQNLWAAATGVLAAVVTLAVAEVFALLLAPTASPLLATGALVIDLAPAWLKNLVIALFGLNDKVVLLVCLGAVVFALAVVVGVLEYRRPPLGVVGLVAVSAVATLAVITRADAGTVSAAPTVIGMVAGVLVLRAAVLRLHRWQAVAAAVSAAGGVPAAGKATSALFAADRAADFVLDRSAESVTDPAADSAINKVAGPAGPAAAAAAAGPAAAGSAAAGSAAAGSAAAVAGTHVAAGGLAAGVGSGDGSAERVSRRGFFVMLGATGAAAIIAGAVARSMNAATNAVTAVRAAFKLPAPAVAAAPIPAGAELGIDGLAPLVSPNDGFYRIDTALQVPNIDPDEWTLKITGMVENEIEITMAELLELPLIESYVTLMCVSNEVGGDLTGNAKWLGYPIRELLARARPLSGADAVLSTSHDGFTATTPLEVLQDPDRDSLLAIGMNGEPLSAQHGFPARMVVPGLYGYVSATKWVVELKVSTFAGESAYWTDRGWSAKGPVKTSSRIDVPKYGATVEPGPVAIAGVAWAQHVGIQRVEVRIDGAEWQDAVLAEAISADTWRQWYFDWDATAGAHTVEVRATDASGFTQTQERVPVAPDGSEGWHTIEVKVA